MHAVHDYVKQVLKGKILAGESIKKTCERHKRDMEASETPGFFFYFDEAAADHAINFYKFLKHSKGKWGKGGGQAFKLEPWQQFIIGSMFGWKRKKDHYRRFQTVYIEVPRKNGKSTLISGIGLYLLIADGESGAEVYAAATKKDQAKITFEEAKRMVKKSPALRKRIRSHTNNLSVLDMDSKFEPLGRDSDSLDGLNVHGALVDEFHAHKDSGIWDVLDSATGSREQPIMLAITTAGFNQTSICYEYHEFGTKVLNTTAQDENFFCFIATADEKDDPFSEEAWMKANPNYGVSVLPDDMKRMATKAKQMPSEMNNFLTKRLNIWTQQANRWINLSLWDANAGMVVEENLKGRECYGGLDLSSVSDITAWVMVFPDENDSEKVDILCRFWCPEARLHDPQNRYADQYKAWKREGFLITTPGDAIDYNFVKQQVLIDASKFQLIDMNIDRLFQGYQLAMELEEEGIELAAMGMGFVSFATPMKEFERRLLNKKLNHGGNPVLRWMADSVSVKQDPAGNLKPDKASSQGKIDGIVALVMSLDRAARHEDNSSIYEKGGLSML